MKRLAVFLLSISSLIPFAQASKVDLGIDVLQAQNFLLLQGKHVGLLSHTAAVNKNGVSTLDVLKSGQGYKLTTLFSPEHGFFGKVTAETKVSDESDPASALKIYSLYSNTKRPTAEMLSDIDVLVIDLQDVGVRCYTYVSAMRYSLEAALENNIDVIVLDRPNPLGGLKVDGPPLEHYWQSYVGAFQVPLIHGLTIGELANIAYDQSGWLQTRGKLTVIPMKNWTRDMLWPDTGLAWFPPSPALKTFEIAQAYPLTVIWTEQNEERPLLKQSPKPFKLIKHKNIPADQIQKALASKNLPGIAFKAENDWVELEITDWNALRPAELNFHLMQFTTAWNAENPYKKLNFNEMVLFNKHVGSTDWWLALTEAPETLDVDSFVKKWSAEAKSFQEWSKKYWLYP